MLVLRLWVGLDRTINMVTLRVMLAGHLLQLRGGWRDRQSEAKNLHLLPFRCVAC